MSSNSLGARAAYQELERIFQRMAMLGEAIGLLHWDMSVMMPPGGAAARTEQLATLKVLRHEILTDPVVVELLDRAEQETVEFDLWRAANLREMRRDWRTADAVPADLVAAHSRACSECETVWRRARADADFQLLMPSLSEVLTLTQRVGEARATAVGCSVYDALLDRFEPAARAEDFDGIFADYAAFLPEFLEQVMACQRTRPKAIAPNGPFAVEAQRMLVRQMAEAVGFDFATGRLDESLHPFSGGIPEDSRITTRYEEGDFTQGLMAVLHEVGHAMYERGRPVEWLRQPVGAARGMALHESQSLTIEMQVCRSRLFLNWAAPIMRAAFGGQGAAWEPENLFRLYTYVEPGLIRVEADEVTYPAHIILRYRLERALVSGQLQLADLPQAWSEGMHDLLGLRPPDDRLGCLQDIHWPSGAWGYFPTYSLGAMMAAQFYDAATREDADIVPAIEHGDFSVLLAWLRSRVHAQGSRFSTSEIVEQATGRPLDPEVFKSHLRSRYLD